MIEVRGDVKEVVIDNVLKKIEYCGRNAYRSHDVMSENSEYKFLNIIKQAKHGSVFEHAGIYLCIQDIVGTKMLRYLFQNNDKVRKYTNITYINNDMYVYTNLRVIFEHISDLFNDIIDNSLPYGVDYFIPMESDPYFKRTFEVTTNIGITREGNRHRTISPTEESTRYCCYIKDKFNNQISFLDSRDVFIHDESYNDLLDLQKHVEEVYSNMIKRGEKPQSARLALTLNTKSTVIYTASNYWWNEFIKLRADKNSHPQIQVIANEINNIINK